MQDVRIPFRKLAFVGLATVLFTAFRFAGLPQASASAAETEMPEPVLLYDFEEQDASDKTIKDKAGQNNGTLKGRTQVQYLEERDSNVLYFWGGNSYLEFPQGFFDGRDTMTISMDICSLMDNENFFTVAIGKDSNRYLFLRTRSGECRYAITKGSWGTEQDVAAVGRAVDECDTCPDSKRDEALYQRRAYRCARWLDDKTFRFWGRCHRVSWKILLFRRCLL